MQEVVIDSIRVSLMNYQRVVILKGKAADMYLPIWIGPGEADSIAVKLQDVSVPRPLTHDLLNLVITTLGGTVTHVLVSDLQNDTFYAKITIQLNGSSFEVDSRPSDAIALAVRVKVPIYVEDAVMEKAGVALDLETGKPIIGGEPEEKAVVKMSEDELKRLSAFKEFIGGLDLEDFEKKQT
ncbi:MAG: bifunctional nuclease family protein [Chloroflexi bacterium]|nr:bifunctional nuclease family protein [Chloroflexota bacterium]